MSEGSVTRWRRYGKDRLYVNGPAGERYGWGDLDSGEITVTEEQYRGLVESLLSGHPAWVQPRPADEATATASPAQPQAELTTSRAPTSRGGNHVDQPRAEPTPSTERTSMRSNYVNRPQRPWVDLALNRPGEGARAQADELRRAAPVRTRVARLLGAHTEERAWRIGADGEESVARELMKLGEPWRTLNAVPVGKQGADIDHVLIGPGGVFTINAKNHPGAHVWVGGDTVLIGRTRLPYVRNARFEAARASRLLSDATGIPVCALSVVVILCDDIRLKAPPPDVVILGRRELRRWLGRLGPVMAPEQVSNIYECARKSTTWQ